MYEVKCDVKDCGERETLFPGMLVTGSLPPGWRLLAYTEQKFVKRDDPTKKIVEAAKKMLPPELSKELGGYIEAMASMSALDRVTPGPFQTQHFKRVMCPKHPIPEFAEEHGDGTDAIDFALPPDDLPRVVKDKDDV